MTCAIPRVFCPVCGGVRFVPPADQRARFTEKLAPVCSECGLASPRQAWVDDPEAPGTLDAWAREMPIEWWP